MGDQISLRSVKQAVLFDLIWIQLVEIIEKSIPCISAKRPFSSISFFLLVLPFPYSAKSVIFVDFRKAAIFTPKIIFQPIVALPERDHIFVDRFFQKRDYDNTVVDDTTLFFSFESYKKYCKANEPAYKELLRNMTVSFV